MINLQNVLLAGAGDDKQKSADDAKKKRKAEMNEKLAALQKEYDDTTLASVKKLDLEKLSYEEPTSDELMELAKKSLGEKYSSKRAVAASDTEKKKKTLAEAIAELSSDAEKKRKTAEDDYGKAISDTENSALKRGVARSSMAQNAVNELVKALANKKSEIETEKNVGTKNVNDKIAEADAELDKTLKSIDDEEKTAVASAFDKLKKESEDKKNEVIKYNNSLEEKEKNFANKTYDVKTEEKLAEIKDSYDYKKLAVALDYYLSIDDKAKAWQEFSEDENMKEILGEYYYTYLFNILRGRAGRS